jgi:hypothetical protein
MTSYINSYCKGSSLKEHFFLIKLLSNALSLLLLGWRLLNVLCNEEDLMFDERISGG